MSQLMQALSNVAHESFDDVGAVQIAAMVFATLYCIYVYYLIASRKTPQVNLATWRALVFLVLSILLHMYVVIKAVLPGVALCSFLGVFFQFLAVVVWSYPTVFADPECNPLSRIRRWARQSRFTDSR